MEEDFRAEEAFVANVDHKRLFGDMINAVVRFKPFRRIRIVLLKLLGNVRTDVAVFLLKWSFSPFLLRLNQDWLCFSDLNLRQTVSGSDIMNNSSKCIASQRAMDILIAGYAAIGMESKSILCVCIRGKSVRDDPKIWISCFSHWLTHHVKDWLHCNNYGC